MSGDLQNLLPAPRIALVEDPGGDTLTRENPEAITAPN